jgi:signal transduction histidine kinase
MSTSTRPLQILLVEDNPGDARILRELLRDGPSLAHEIVHVSRLAEARERLSIGGVDVVLLDLSLPDAHGLETVIGALQSAGDVPIIVLTGLDDEGLALRSVQAGAQDYLVKGQIETGLLTRSIRYARERMALLRSERAARERAEMAVRARDDVLHVVSHDLGNSLSAITITTSVLLKSVPEAETALRGGIVNIRELAREMQRLRQDLLDVASIEAGQLSIELEVLDLAELLDTVLERFQPLADEKRVQLGTHVEALGRSVSGDRERLLQAIGNLVGNAIKFTPACGEVGVSVTSGAGEASIQVRDTGPGIDAESLNHIFDRFYKRATGNRTGTGLGLTIARGITEAHGGTLKVESRPNRGSTFCITLPLARRASPSEEGPRDR